MKHRRRVKMTITLDKTNAAWLDKVVSDEGNEGKYPSRSRLIDHALFKLRKEMKR